MYILPNMDKFNWKIKHLSKSTTNRRIYFAGSLPMCKQETIIVCKLVMSIWILVNCLDKAPCNLDSRIYNICIIGHKYTTVFKNQIGRSKNIDGNRMYIQYVTITSEVMIVELLTDMPMWIRIGSQYNIH
jgi:hypothetical protein